MGVLVIGAHRSGTSALAGALEAAGLFVGPSTAMISPLPENPEGFFELQAVADLNDEILRHLGGAWDSPPVLPDDLAGDPKLGEFVHRASELIAVSYDGRNFLIKDPRIALLLPIWRRAMLDRCCAVMIVRDPVAVSWSLALRNGLTPFASFALWSAYNRSAIKGLSGLPVHVCSYAELVDLPAAAVDSIVQSLYAWGELSSEVDAEAVAARIKPELRRDTWPRGEMTRADPPAEIVALDRFLMALNGRHDHLEVDALPEIGAWERPLLEERRRAYIGSTVLRKGLDSLEDERKALQTECKALQTECKALQTECDALRQERMRLEAMIDRADQLNEALEISRQTLDESQRTHSALESRLRDQEQLIVEIQESEVYRATYPLRWAINRSQRARGMLARQRAVGRFPTRLQISAALSQARLLKKDAVTAEATNQDRATIRRSGIFDAGFYLQRYPEAKSKGNDPLEHYLRFGARKGYRPHPLFDPIYYVNQLPGSLGGTNPLAHYIRNQGSTSADPHPLFDGNFYRETYLKDDDPGIDPFLHYLSVGGPAGNAPNRVFDVPGYTFEHPDVRQYGNALRHYVELGHDAGFSPHPLFEADWYLATYPEVAQAGIDAYEHFVRKGQAEGKLGSRALNGNPDITGPFPIPTGGKSPRVTVIIPTYDSYFDTFRCLTSLSRTATDFDSYQVTLVDDCPENPVRSLLVDHPGLDITTNDANCGFLRSCNRAAAHVRTEYIAFLNNDTIVTAGWLSSLVALADKVANVGLIGSKLLNLDDTIQDAGDMILRNGWGHPLCAGRERTLHEANYVREVDCIIGACMLVRRSAFESVGGFDDRYAPAFYEEFDLAFKLRHEGFRVLYQPKSEIYHIRSSSYGADERNALSQRNHAQFVTKWSQELTDHCESADLSFKGMVRGCPAGTILVIEDQVPEPDKHAGAVTMTQYLHLLAEEGFRVILWPDDRIARSPYTENLQQAGIEVVYGDESFVDWLRKAGSWIDYVLLARPHIAINYLDHLRRRSHARLLYYTHDLHFLREQRRYDIDGDREALRKSLQYRELETKIFNTVDCVCTPSVEEVPVIHQLAPSVEVVVLTPYFYDPEPIGSIERSRLENNRDILFVGGYGHTPNIDAAIVLVEQVMPLVWQEIPDARVVLVGSKPPKEILELAGPRVQVAGFVPDLEPLYASARMTVNPLRYGAGVKGKIVESLRHNVPVVTTPIGAEGIGLTSGHDALVGETVRELAEHAIRLFREPELLYQLADAGAQTVRTRFSRDLARRVIAGAVGVSRCGLCGTVSNVWSNQTSSAGSTCASCSAIAPTEALARVIYEPYRCFTVSCLADVISQLSHSTIHGFGLDRSLIQALTPIAGFTATDVRFEAPLDQPHLDRATRQARVDLDFADEALDLMLSQDFLDNVPDLKITLNEIFRTLKRGGRHISMARFPGGEDRDGLRAHIGELIAETGFEVRQHEVALDGPGGPRAVFFDGRRPVSEDDK